MKILANNIYSFILFIIFSITSPVIATVQASTSPLLEFALSVQNQTSDLKFTSTSYKTQTSQLGINWYEPFTSYFHAGLEFGFLEMSQADNTLVSARFTSGEYAGFLLRFIPLETEQLSLSLNFNYRYNQSTGETTSQVTKFAWNETLFSTQIEYQAIDHIGLFVAAEILRLNGEQRDFGTVTKISEFSESGRQNIRFGLNFTSQHGGVIGVEQITGYKRGTRLYFMRKF
ncbi:MAG: hypothetical protein OEY78_09425 [Gammaproteobacteria bacterium]|nr:hypothetical protein [Gammaproteobacteria bacterium]